MFQGLPSPVLQDPRLSFLLFGEELQGEEEGGNREVLPELGGLLCQANSESVSLEGYLFVISSLRELRNQGRGIGRRVFRGSRVWIQVDVWFHSSHSSM